MTKNALDVTAWNVIQPPNPRYTRAALVLSFYRFQQVRVGKPTSRPWVWGRGHVTSITGSQGLVGYVITPVSIILLGLDC